MIKRNLVQIAEMCGGKLVHAEHAEVVAAGVITDSRKITPGCLFVPLVGEQFDGHSFAAEAIEQSAAAILWQKDHGTPPEGPVILVEDTLQALQHLSKAYLTETKARVIGITGSNGKTTTKDIVASLLATTYKVHKTNGNFNNHIGLPLTILSMPEDSEIAILEMGMSARYEIEFLSKLAEPETAMITNIGESHLLQLGSREEIARAKVEILAGMKPGGLLVYNGDEPLIPMVLQEPDTRKPDNLKLSTYGVNSTNDDYPTGMMFQSGGTVFTSYSGHSDTAYRIPLLGEHNVINALGAITVARHYGVTEANIVEGLEQLELTSMRIEMIEGVSGIAILNDAYNASPTSVKAAIGVLEKMKGYRRKVAVLGDMLELGGLEERYHEEIGQFITPDKVDLLYTYGPLGSKIAQGAASNLPDKHIHAYTDKTELIRALIQELTPKDVVLIKASRGMKLEEVAQAITIDKLQS
ncbi:UDP-N-acetylmuramoyl-tripeptide--D-alanyl-D-alanine ligase [Paenibacillus zeisoli]|uniref:UDP-N-acetylmuramoyl-tripeptide--D-alanyl-D-alanine ligase n=1 Tax=Paenibacillus zeisoli TaxID=2496267 RepID=A0A433XQK4_9BACL|nr:UDP-N-acetylmuramoyl-tripeptide--D-alanyl-D-alanine ligase [Paenibacillus zeisoli]RUT36382.1 UDP-N-acetylmuramoyl-tripeptide--D-alanyl-D-alanine ligase [Paenibacillus zeisoli]